MSVVLSGTEICLSEDCFPINYFEKLFWSFPRKKPLGQITIPICSVEPVTSPYFSTGGGQKMELHSSGDMQKGGVKNMFISFLTK